MAERPELLGLAAEIVSAHVSHIFNALATAEQAATAPPRAEPAVAVKRSIFPRSCRLPGLRQTSHHAEATFDDGSPNDAGAVSHCHTPW